jgi:hypothetical protein
VKWETKAVWGRGSENKGPDKILPGRPLVKMIKCWDENPCIKGERNNEWLNTVFLSGPKIFFLPEFGSDKDWVCQLLIEHFNDKSSVTQEEMEYALCWRQSLKDLFPLKKKKKSF